MDCSVAHGKQDCSCPWKHRMTDIYGSTCTLRQYYYTVSFKLNTSLESQNCSVYAPRVKAAMRTALGYQVHAVTIANCTDNITARLILNDPLPKPLQKRLQACEHPIGDVCMLYPMLPIVRGSATEIEEENLCDSLLKEQEGAYNGVNECVKAGDIFWFKCKQGYREVDVKTQGRLQRSICEVDPEAPTPAPDPCLTVGAEVCGDVRCEPYSDNSGFTCKCGIDFFFHAMEKRCYNMKSCKVHKCERGLCVDQNGMFPASCQCNDYPDLTLNCKVKETVRAICATQDKVARINPDNSVSCDCPPHTKLIRGYCKPIACLNATLTCKDVCLMKDSHRDTRCCRNWDRDHCERTPHNGSFCPPGYIADLDTKECKHVCNTTHATDICDHGCTQLSEDKADYTCNCGPTQQLANDGISCVERTKCHEEDVIKCESEQKTCFYDNGKAVCRCRDNTLEINGTCIDSCTSTKQRECSVIFGKCKIINHYEACMCIEPLLWHPEEKKCFLEKTHKYVARFRVNDTSSPSAEYGVGECDDKHAMMEQAMQILYGASLTSIRMLQCFDEYKVELNFASEPPSVLLGKIRTCEHPNENGGCFFPPALNIVKDSVSEVREEDLCETYLTGNLGHMKGLYVCKKRENGRYALQCSEKYKSMSYFSQGMLDISICTEQKCELYCTGPERQCVEGKCVCHVNYFEDAEGVCVPHCSRKPCKNGGTCETGVRTSFYCSCPPYFTGPTCEVPFQAYADAQKKLSAVGVVLSVLIMFCVGAAAVVIRRIKNRNRAYEDL
nr:glycoprotein antigen BM86-like [Rhipicephalus microplus]